MKVTPDRCTPEYIVTFHSKPIWSLVMAFCVWGAVSTSVCLAAGIKPPATGEFYDFSGPTGLSGISADSGATTELADVNGSKVLKIDFGAPQGYPGINFTAPPGGWDLSGFAGIQIKVTNPGAEAVTVNMKVENEGDWKTSPWSVDMVNIGPGETQILKVVFGQSFGHAGFKLDLGHITNVRFFITPPKNPVSLLLGNPKLFKDAAALESDEVPTPAGPGDVPPDPAISTAGVKPSSVFASTPLLDISGKHDFPSGGAISDSAASQLPALCSLAEFRAFPEADRHVYSFDVWPSEKESLEAKNYSFNFHLGTEGSTSQKVAFLPDAGQNFTRAIDPATKQNILTGFGNLDWGGTPTYVFKFDKPVLAFGVVLRSSGDFEMRRFLWAGSDQNGYPVSYTLSDGTVVQLGQREKRGALLKAGADSFLGVVDRSGHGIVSVTYTLKGLAGNMSQNISMVDMAFVSMPQVAVAPVINLKGAYDFSDPDSIVGTPLPYLEGLASLDNFRFIVANHRYVYDFGTWPLAKPDLGSNTGTFSFDLKGKGNIDEKVTITATSAAKTTLTQETLKKDDSQPYKVLGGLGDIGNGAWAQQTFKFEKPVWGFGVVYRSPDEIHLAKTGQDASYPISYTLSDGTIVNLGTSGKIGGVIAGGSKTFVGLIDKTDKGISSVTVRVQGTAQGTQPFYIEELAFALAGPPPGNWKLTMHDEFDGDKLNPAYWATGYTFPDVINGELEGFVPENVTVTNGICTIKAEKRDCVNTDREGRHGAAQKFASGSFTSYDKFTQTYGYFEARIKMPHARGAGIWPAFWMLPDRGKEFQPVRGDYKTDKYGMGSEIDIFEFMPRWKQLDGLFPIHCGTIWDYGPETPQSPAPHGYGSFALANDGWGPEELHFPRLDSEFHTYGIYWSPQRLIFYLDSKPFYRIKDPKNIPDVPEYFLFNISIHRNGWGKNPGGSQPTYSQILGDMPNDMQIDYFRAYSGVLEEDVPTPQDDLPVVKKYAPPALEPPKGSTPEAAPLTPNPTPAPTNVPAAPINSTISTPSNG